MDTLLWVLAIGTGMCLMVISPWFRSLVFGVVRVSWTIVATVGGVLITIIGIFAVLDWLFGSQDESLL